MLRYLLRRKKNFTLTETESQPANEFDEVDFVRSVFGFTPDSFVRSAISIGQSNLSLTQFSCDNGPFMIRKSISKAGSLEAAFMQEMCDSRAGLKCVFDFEWPLPEVYAVVEGPQQFDIYMQHVDGISYRNKVDAAPLARPLAKAIHELSLVLTAMFQNIEMTPSDRGSPGQVFFAKAESHMGAVDAERLREIVRFQRLLPKQLSHNDIFWPNMGITCIDEVTRFVFIDFGMLGLNVPGAELHHFARNLVRSRHDAEFFRRLCKNYAAHVRLSPVLIEMNALLYGSMRLVAYEANKSDKEGLFVSNTAGELMKETLLRFDSIKKMYT